MLRSILLVTGLQASIVVLLKAEHSTPLSCFRSKKQWKLNHKSVGISSRFSSQYQTMSLLFYNVLAQGVVELELWHCIFQSISLIVFAVSRCRVVQGTNVVISDGWCWYHKLSVGQFFILNAAATTCICFFVTRFGVKYMCNGERIIVGFTVCMYVYMSFCQGKRADKQRNGWMAGQTDTEYIHTSIYLHKDSVLYVYLIIHIAVHRTACT